MDLTELKKKIKHMLMSDYDSLMKDEIVEDEIRRDIDQIIETLSTKEKDLVRNIHTRRHIVDEIVDSIVGFGPLKPLLQDPKVTEIMINRYDRIFAEKNGKMELMKTSFNNEQELMQFIHKIVSSTQRRVDESNPYVDFSISDGSRVNVILPPLSLDGPAITIRKFLREISSIDDLIARNTLTEDMARFLITAVRSKCNIIFSGATGSGKTTTLNILSKSIDKKERVVTIEDTAELRLEQDNIVRLETRQANVEGRGEITIRDLFRNSLRMRPDRIILGEIRAQEALDMLMAILSGHNGSMAIVHSGSPQETISRVETMIAMSNNLILPLWVVRKQITDALDLIVHQAQMPDGSRRITHITEVGDFTENEVVLCDLFVFDLEESLEQEEVKGSWRKTGKVPKFLNKLRRVDRELTEDFFKS